MRSVKATLVCLLFISLANYAYAEESIATDPAREQKLRDLGQALFFDVNLSLDRTQSCATCHDPARAFVDWRESGVGAAASMGGDMHTIGDRNAPTISYASQIPVFQLNENNDYVGGLFWDGRADTLAAQAGGPPLNPDEMAMPDSSLVQQRLKENMNYGYAFKDLFGDDVLDDPKAAFAGMQESIAAFESTEFFSPFDSRYDRYLRGEYTPTEQETLGMTLFFSNQFANCNKCHQLQTLPESKLETFSNYRYHNIGVPANSALREANGRGAAHVDHGLLENPAIDDAAQDGKFRVPTLRNVAITAPYMHNGVFADLRTVVKFYNKYQAKGSKAQINPETDQQWGAPEVANNIALEELQSTRALDERSVDALVAFMRMLTDKRYEPLLEFEE
ncbi:MAG: cytochrome c peroxidase [Pseudomonadota bacterium]